MCLYNSVMLPFGHMTSLASLHPGEGSSSVLFWRFLPFFSSNVFSFSWEFFLIPRKVKGQGCDMCTDCKALWGKFVICDIELYEINWIELKGIRTQIMSLWPQDLSCRHPLSRSGILSRHTLGIGSLSQSHPSSAVIKYSSLNGRQHLPHSSTEEQSLRLKNYFYLKKYVGGPARQVLDGTFHYSERRPPNGRGFKVKMPCHMSTVSTFLNEPEARP